MKTEWMLLAAAVAVLLVGCKTTPRTAGEAAGVETQVSDKGRVFLTIDFELGRTLRYRFSSRREITLDWDPNAAETASRVQKHTEQMEMVVAYTPVEVDPYGVSTIRATVELVQAVRSGGPTQRATGTDAVVSAQGQSYTIKVDSRGRIVDANELRALIARMGAEAFQGDASRGRTKNPDMIGDFIAGTWFLWDAMATIPLPAEGLIIGQKWPSQLPASTPMVMRQARDVTYRFNGFRSGPRGSVGVIESTYKPADAAPADWPVPYSGRFRMSGTFGFLGPYEVLGLEGTGEDLFNIKTGRLERRSHRYTMQFNASLPPMGIQAHPHLTIEQTLTVELLDPETGNSNIETRNPKQIQNPKQK
ncbi:MAG: hypothetical protein KBE65_20990 [Phycisphaerae bacterium]|nr:hypothetical protein [Phycisphaerae bacterium]